MKILNEKTYQVVKEFEDAAYEQAQSIYNLLHTIDPERYAKWFKNNCHFSRINVDDGNVELEAYSNGYTETDIFPVRYLWMKKDDIIDEVIQLRDQRWAQMVEKRAAKEAAEIAAREAHDQAEYARLREKYGAE